MSNSPSKMIKLFECIYASTKNKKTTPKQLSFFIDKIFDYKPLCLICKSDKLIGIRAGKKEYYNWSFKSKDCSSNNYIHLDVYKDLPKLCKLLTTLYKEGKLVGAIGINNTSLLEIYLVQPKSMFDMIPTLEVYFKYKDSENPTIYHHTREPGMSKKLSEDEAITLIKEHFVFKVFK